MSILLKGSASTMFLRVGTGLSYPLVTDSRVQSRVTMRGFRTRLFSRALTYYNCGLILLMGTHRGHNYGLLGAIFHHGFNYFTGPHLVTVNAPIVCVTSGVFRRFTGSMVLFSRGPRVCFQDVISGTVAPYLMFFPEISI